MQNKALKEGFPVYSFKSAASRLKGPAGDNLKATLMSMKEILPSRIKEVGWLERRFEYEY
jgi:hypothetical protein